VVRLNANGTLDNGFGSGGKVLLDLGANTADSATSVVTQSDGKILLAGSTNAQSAGSMFTFNYGVVRLNANGTLDNGFGSGGKVLLDLGANTADYATSVVTQSDGKILIVGYTTAQPAGGAGPNNYGVVRLNADGTLDTSFNPVSSLNGQVTVQRGASAAAVLDSTVVFTDPELAALNAGAGNYNGARLVLQRDGGADSGDEFSGTGNLTFEAPTTAGLPGRVLLGANTATSTQLAIGSWTQGGGKLELLFNSNASQSAVNQAASAIGYRYTSTTPLSTNQTAQIRWQFFDGNSTASQGTGGELSVSGTTLVTIKEPPAEQASLRVASPATSVSLPSTAVDPASAATVLQLKIADNDNNNDGTPDGGGDGKPTQLNALTLQLGALQPSLASLLNYSISGGSLSAPVAGTLASDGKSLSFNFLGSPLSVADNSSATFNVNAWYGPGAVAGAVTDNTEITSLSLSSALSSLSAPATGSTAISAITAASTTIKSTVTATQLKLIAPSQATSGAPLGTITVQAVDASGNLDIDFSDGNVSLALAPGSSSFGPLQGKSGQADLTTSFVKGVASFSKVVLPSTGYASLNLQATHTPSAAAALSTGTTSIATAVKATKLSFSGTPSTTVLASGAATTINGLKLQAVDGANLVDRNWLASSGTRLRLSLVDPTDNQLNGSLGGFSLAGDTDSSPTSVTLGAAALASDGSIDLGGLQITYSQASSSDALALKAELVDGNGAVVSSLTSASIPLTSQLATTPAPTLSLGNGAPAQWIEAGGVDNQTAGSGPVAIAPSADLGSGSLKSLQVVIGNVQAGDLLALSTSVPAISAEQLRCQHGCGHSHPQQRQQRQCQRLPGRPAGPRLQHQLRRSRHHQPQPHDHGGQRQPGERHQQRGHHGGPAGRERTCPSSTAWPASSSPSRKTPQPPSISPASPLAMATAAATR
jgi:uncharacterized delta-60 repeat protein